MRRTDPSAADLRAVTSLAGELGELSAVSLLDARKHLVTRLPTLIGDSAVWWNVSTPAPEGTDLTVVASDVHGLDEDRFQRWLAGYLTVCTYRDHPMWNVMFSAPRAQTRRREEIVSDGAWNKSAHVADWVRGFDLDDTIGSVAPLSAGVFATLAVARPLGQRRYSARDSKVIEHLQRCIHWLHVAAFARATMEPLELLRASLPGSYARVLDELLAGRSEKAAASRLGLSARTVHKYVERVYRVFSVSSRAELMALFITPQPKPTARRERR